MTNNKEYEIGLTDKSRQLILLVNDGGNVGSVESKDGTSTKVEGEGDDDLEDGLSKDHHPHLARDEGRRLAVGLALEGLGVCGIGGEGESGKGAEGGGQYEEKRRRR